MEINPPSASGNQNEKQILTEVGKSEKQLLAWIHSKGLLHPDVRELYRKVCGIFENAILNNHKLSELQDVEYSLWKVHYKHIDEFRKILKNGSGNAEGKKSGRTQNGFKCNDNHMQEFKFFLSEATEYYKKLILKVRKSYQIPEEALFYKRGYFSASVEPNDLLTCQFLCHRFSVCMGDLARYREQYEVLDTQHHNWSVAASHYFEATRICPDSGNPQNQLAVLATYIGNEFLALYHCVRSLAVKKPFPDARNNLVLLLEKNRSYHLQYLSCEVTFNFLRPSDRATSNNKSQSDEFSNCSMLDAGANHSLYGNLLPLIVRTISFFFIKPSNNIEEFDFTFASTMRVLDKMMEQDDTTFTSMMESYQNLNASKTGPFRAIQFVSMFIFVLKYLVTEQNVSNVKDDAQNLVLTKFALATTFSFMGRFAERCLKAKPLVSCPLLPAVLVLAEWSVTMLDEIELYRINEEGRIAMSYFVGVYSELASQLKAGMSETSSTSSNGIPLWEDYELRGFVPLASVHASLDFSGNWENLDNYESGTELRVQRLIYAANKISNRSNDYQKQVTFDFPDKKEPKAVAITPPGPEVEEIIQQSYEVSEKKDILTVAEYSSNTSDAGEDKSRSLEEEEVIVFRPLMRYNSAPLYTEASLKGQSSVIENEDLSLPADEHLRRATSVLMAQNADVQSGQSGFHTDFTHFRRNEYFENEPYMSESTINSTAEGLSFTGPPSLNAWVLNRASFSKDKGTSGITEHLLPPIEELASSSMADVSISEEGNSNISSVEESSVIVSQSQTPIPYSAPAPSAPLLPEDAEWFTDDKPDFFGRKNLNGQMSTVSYQEASSIQSKWTALSTPLGYNPGLPTFKHAYPPPGKMTSSEWLHWYRENHSTGQDRDYLWSPQFTSPIAANTENLQSHGCRRLDNHFDQWGNLSTPKQHVHMEPPPLNTYLPSAFNADDHKRDRVLQNFQKSTPYGCGAVTDLRLEPQLLLQYLKEKEWQLLKESTPRSPSYMGN